MYIQHYSMLEWFLTDVGLAYALLIGGAVAVIFWGPLLLITRRRPTSFSVPVGIGAVSCINVFIVLLLIGTSYGGFGSGDALFWLLASSYLVASIVLATSLFVVLALRKLFVFEATLHNVASTLLAAIAFEAGFVVAVPLLILGASEVIVVFSRIA